MRASQCPCLRPRGRDAMADDAEGAGARLTIDARSAGGARRRWRASAPQALGPDMSVAIMVVDNATGEVLARVGSPDYFDARRAGQIDLTPRVRSPGSALKPFIYGLGFEDGLVHPETLIEDRPVRYGSYAPENFDDTFHGTVTVRRALQQSLERAGGRGARRGRPEPAGGAAWRGRRDLVLPRREAPGLALGLGGVGIRLTDLAMLYAGLARGGHRPAAQRAARCAASSPPSACSSRSPPGMSPRSCKARRRRRTPRAAASPSRPAPPTAIATPGRSALTASAPSASGSAVRTARRSPGLAGRTAAAPILFEPLRGARSRSQPLPPAPTGALIATTAKLPPPLQRFASRMEAAAGLTPPVHIVFPPDGASVELSAHAGEEPDPLPIKIAGGTPPLTVLLNGMPLEAKPTAETLLRAGGTRLRAPHRDRRDRRGRQRAGAPAIAAGASAISSATNRRLCDMLGLALALGRGEFVELLLAHRFVHALGCTFELARARLAALGGERRAGGFLLRC